MELLCISNGHGEDQIALQILQKLRSRSELCVCALPLVGTGHAYRQADIPLIGPARSLPSGGFIYMDPKELWRDLQGGLVGLTWTQWQALRRWRGNFVLSVGDIVPLLFAWLSGLPYGFVGTAKSDYYLQDNWGWYPRTSRWERWSGSVYWPWERWLLGRSRCQAIFPRDRLTYENLHRLGLQAADLGNPMMDVFETPSIPVLFGDTKPMVAVLLPGSRSPEVKQNWQRILRGVESLCLEFAQYQIWLLAAIAPSLSLDAFVKELNSQGWRLTDGAELPKSLCSQETLVFAREVHRLALINDHFAACLQAAEFAVATTGTATEQFSGLGKPVFTLPGPGPQFTAAFAEAQSRLLGPGIIVVQSPMQLGAAIANLLQDPDRLQDIAQQGPIRMGCPGSAARIAAYILSKMSGHQ
ncbi:MAG: lipid-A-disaccharide synthase-related protein [Cyanobacteria bacterium P01_H01_bin.15]